MKETTNGAIIDVIIQPKASHNEIVGMHDDALKIKLTAPPVDGKANAALIAFLAKMLGIPKSSITILRGETSRRKTIAIESMSTEKIASKLRIT